MVQFKPYFTGEMIPPQSRLTSVQKCFRTTDIDSVGDSTHLTFFEMLGNFSVGDYFKNEAIAFAWEFVTECLKLDKDRLWATVFQDDDEALGYWIETGIPVERIRHFGERDNFWGPAGNEGPCGPCSEIHYDFGEAMGCGLANCGPNCENVTADTGFKCDRFVELWNLVFMQFYQSQDGSRVVLPAPNIDTGMGLERCAVIVQGKHSIYETDMFQPLAQKVADFCGKEYGRDAEIDYAIRVVAEHARSATFLVSDGVVPGNDGRDYVLRRVIRRAIRYGKKLGLNEPFLAPMCRVVIDLMSHQYQDLEERSDFIARVISLEEDRFGETFTQGYGMVLGMIGQRVLHKTASDELMIQIEKTSVFEEQTREVVAAAGLPMSTIVPISEYASSSDGAALASRVFQSAFLKGLESFDAGNKDPLHYLAEQWPRQITGSETFVLYDTYGFPPELAREIAAEQGVGVDMEGFREEMELQRSQSRAAENKFGGDFDSVRAYQDLSLGTPFLGYDTLTMMTSVVGLLLDGKSASQVEEGQHAEILLSETPFYAEMGGQIGDMGEVVGPDGNMIVEDTQAPIAGVTVHWGTVTTGVIKLGDIVEARVDSMRRQDTARNHTATHMLHSALRQILGSHVRQHGSLVSSDRLRFDFTHISPLTRKELHDVQYLTNEKIRDNVAVSSGETTYRQALSQGALAFFGDRYGDSVRVVEVAQSADQAKAHPPFSMEVCGGTHVSRSGDIGYCHIVSEIGIGSGIRRIEAVTGRKADLLVSQQTGLLDEISNRLQVSTGDLTTRVGMLLEDLDHAQKRAESLEKELLRRQVAGLSRKNVSGISVVAGELSVSAVELLREAGDWLRNDLKSGVVVLATVLDGRPTMMIMATKDLVELGFHAGNVVKEAAKVMGGGGGGRPDLAQAGGRDPLRLVDAFQVVEKEVRLWRENL